MNLCNLHTLGALLGSSILAIAGIGPGNLACSSTGPVETDTELTIKGPGFEVGIGVRVKTHGKDPNRTFEAKNESGKTKTGCVRFMDPDGNPIGSPETFSIPAGMCVSGSLPPGATDYEISDGPCEEEESSDSANSAGGGKIRPTGMEYEHFFQGGSLVPDPFGATEVTYALTVYTLSQRDAVRMKDAILANGLDAPLPSIRGVNRVEVHFYAESTVDLVNGKLILTFADDRSFSSLELGLNGDPTYATIADGIPFAAANGWDAYRFVLPLADFNYDPTSGAHWRNDFEVVYENGGSTDTFHYSGFLEYESE